MRILTHSLILLATISTLSAYSVYATEESPNLGLGTSTSMGLSNMTDQEKLDYARRLEAEAAAKDASESNLGLGGLLQPALTDADKAALEQKEALSKMTDQQKADYIKQQAGTAATKSTAPQTTVKTITPGGSLPTGTASVSTKSTADQSPSSMTDLQKQRTAARERIRRPPVFIQDSAESDAAQSAANSANLPNTITVYTSAKYTWSPDDVKTIAKTLGYSPNDIPQHCQLRFDGVFSTNMPSRSRFPIVVYAGAQATTKFDGLITLFSIQPRAVCDPPANLPKSGRPIRVTGNKYTVQLNPPFNCQAGSSLPSSSTGVLATVAVGISYNGPERFCRFMGSATATTK